METLFSCRNCIHDAAQSLHLGRGHGYCIKHDSVLQDPSDTTCKYHHRKDLPWFVVDEARSEHAAEFAGFTALASLSEHKALRRVQYSEKYYWEQKQLDAITNSLAQYHKSGKSWVFVQAFAGSHEPRRGLVHGCLVRRYMEHCGTWASSYRQVLAVVGDLMRPLCIVPEDLAQENPSAADTEDSVWDVFFARLSCLQEYGWHSGLEALTWATDRVNGGLSDLDWTRLAVELKTACPVWLDLIIKHATDNGSFFTQPQEELEQQP